jgi:hypothetical protein
LSVESQVYTAVQGNGAVQAIVSDRVYPAKAPAGAALPYVTFQRVSTTGDQTHGEVSGLDRASLQFSCWAATYVAAHDLAVAVRASLENQTLGSGAKAIFEDAGDLPSLDEYIFGRRLDFAFWDRT